MFDPAASVEAARPAPPSSPAPTDPAPSAAAEIAHEQSLVDKAYENLDFYRAKYRAEQRKVEAQGAWGSPQARTERDALAAHYGDQATRLEQVEERLVFGRSDLGDGTTVYIGRAGLRDDDGTRLLVDWRAPAAQTFYQATAVDPQGLVRRRHIGTRLRKVQSVEDELLDAAAAQARGLHFQGEGALIAALSQAREGHMGDIVATIQAEQDAVIRAPEGGLLVVQGGPGTGKTAVALHRAAYLLYTHRERLERSGVLVVGPSPVFLRYIEKVLPSLGESGVVSLTMGELLPGLQVSRTDPFDVTEAKGSLAWVPTLRAAVKDLQRIPEETHHFRLSGRPVKLTPEMVRAARTKARRSGKPHNEARDVFALDLVEGLVDQLAGADTDLETRSWWREEVRGNVDVRREINLCWMPTRPLDLLSRLFSRPELLARVNRGLTRRELDLVRRRSDAPVTVADVPLLDELEELLGSSPVLEAPTSVNPAAESGPGEEEIERAQEAIDRQELGGGIVNARMLAERAQGEQEWSPLVSRARADRQWAYGHVVVDEAQDLTPMDWHVLLRRCPSLSFTVVGDLDQRRGHTRHASWYDALGPAARALSDERALTISYRTPRSLTDLAQDVLASLGEPVKFPLTSAREVPDALNDTRVEGEQDLLPAVEAVVAREETRLDEEFGAGSGRIGVLVSQGRADLWGADSEGTSSLTQRVSLLTVAAAKGLEFDTTILVEPTEILADGPGDLFVAMTRSTQRLHSVRAGALPQVWEDALTSFGTSETAWDRPASAG